MMIFLKLLLISSGLMFISEAASIHNESSLCYQPSKYIKPIHYDIKLISCIEGHIFYGEYNISISILNKTQQIFLQSEKLSIKDIVLFTNVKKYHEYDKDTVYKLTYNIVEDTINISLIAELSPGNYILNIKYHGIADEVFRIYDVKGKIAWVADIHFHIICTRQRFSCWDEQNLLLKTTFNISVGCNQCTALSNMPLQNVEENEYKVLWTHFATTSAMSPYLVTMIVSNFLSRIDYDNQNIQMWCNNEYEFHMKFAKNFAENITLLLKNKWNLRSKQILNVTHIAIPNFHDNGIIDIGLVFYKETDIIYDKNLYPISHKIEVAQLIGRKVIEEWFNIPLNSLLMSNFLIKRGFNALFAMYAVNMSYPDSRIGNLFVVQNQHYSFNLDDYLWNWYYYMGNSTLKVHGLLEIPNSIRATFMLRMMEHLFTGGTLQKLMSSYHELSHRLSSVGLELNVTESLNQYMHYEIPRIKDWALQKRCPLIRVERGYNDSRGQTLLRIQYTRTDKIKLRDIPLTFTTETSPNFDNFITQFLSVSQISNYHLKRMVG
ncbi:glutamyl aminopeptidase-like [Nylanderia fulva]|uniref:glutamyl aminopeptidase-like n=1 Tax=Nylanderia fulva TaxID=613905 RepID=UPI0010FB5F64|nr:glutamyl aminopeptidase-like [Nylanderia fulva]